MKAMMYFINKHRVKSLSFILVLVLFGSVTLTTKTRYASYVSDYAAVSAGQFYFGSNYLAPAEDGMTYTISSWSKILYSVTLQIQNYENKLLYNEAGVDFYYAVEGAMYTDEACTQLNSSFDVIIEHAEAGTDDDELITIDGVTYARLNGTEAFDKTEGNKNVTVTAQSTGAANATQYLKIRAYTVPVLPESEDIEVEQLTEGVFFSELEAVFVLNNSSGSADVDTILSQNEKNAEVQLTILCPEMVNAATQTVRVYYRTDKLEPNIASLPTSVIYDDEYSYSELTIKSSSSTTVTLRKITEDNFTVTMGTSDSSMGDLYVQTGVDATVDDTVDDTVDETVDSTVNENE